MTGLYPQVEGPRTVRELVESLEPETRKRRLTECDCKGRWKAMRKDEWPRAGLDTWRCPECARSIQRASWRTDLVETV